MPHVSSIWLQSSNPRTDFRGGGVLALENLIYFRLHFPKAFNDFVYKSRVAGFPMAAALINVTVSKRHCSIHLDLSIHSCWPLSGPFSVFSGKVPSCGRLWPTQHMLTTYLNVKKGCRPPAGLSGDLEASKRSMKNFLRLCISDRMDLSSTQSEHLFISKTSTSRLKFISTLNFTSFLNLVQGEGLTQRPKHQECHVKLV